MPRSLYIWRNRPTLLQVAVHVGAWIPLAVLLFDFLTNQLSVNPIQAAEKRTGNIALILLVLSLACTPVNLLFHFPQALKVRRALGLYGYFYAAMHLLIFTGLDYGFDPQQLLQAFTEKVYIIAGLTAFILLTSLAITSSRYWKKRLGKGWKRLHQSIYAINLIVVLHFAWSLKGDLLRLHGEIARPVLAGVIILALLVFRIPAVRRSVAGQRRQNTHQAITAPRPSEKSRSENPGISDG